MSERKRKLEVYDAQPSVNGVGSAVPSFGNGTVNLYTGKPYSQRYYDILSKRKGEARTPAPAAPSPPPAFPCTCRHRLPALNPLSAALSTAAQACLHRCMESCMNRPTARVSQAPGFKVGRSLHSSWVLTASTFCAGLPVWQARDDFVAMINGHQTTILVGETGSGKTTQIAQFIAEAGYCSSRKLIACTQVRAADSRSLSTHVSPLHCLQAVLAPLPAETAFIPTRLQVRAMRRHTDTKWTCQHS